MLKKPSASRAATPPEPAAVAEESAASPVDEGASRRSAVDEGSSDPIDDSDEDAPARRDSR